MTFFLLVEFNLKTLALLLVGLNVFLYCVFWGHSQCDGIDKHVNSFKYQFNHLTDCRFEKYFLEKYQKKMFDKRLRSKSIIWVHYLNFQFLIACKFMCEVILTNIIEKFAL